MRRAGTWPAPWRWAGRDIRYRLAPEHGLEVGDPVTVAIDWDRRYRLMRLHFAAEIVLELAYAALPGAEKVGAHIAADKARIDFAWPEPVTALLPGLAESANDLVAADRPIAVSGRSRASPRSPAAGRICAAPARSAASRSSARTPARARSASRSS